MGNDTRTYEVRTYANVVAARFEAADKAAAKARIAANQSLLPHEASRLVRLENARDGAENVVWCYPAAWDYTDGGVRTGLMAEGEDY